MGREAVKASSPGLLCVVVVGYSTSRLIGHPRMMGRVQPAEQPIDVGWPTNLTSHTTKLP